MSKHLTINKPQTLFVSEEQNVAVDRTIISMNYSFKTKLQKQSMLKLLVHGYVLMFEYFNFIDSCKKGWVKFLF